MKKIQITSLSVRVPDFVDFQAHARPGCSIARYLYGNPLRFVAPTFFFPGFDPIHALTGEKAVLDDQQKDRGDFQLFTHCVHTGAY